MTKVILYFQAATLSSSSWREKIAGVYRYASKANWQVQLVQSGATAAEIKYMIEAWRPIGCIVDRSLSRVRNPTALFRGIPVVLMEQDPETASGDYSNVNHDSAASARLAVEELIRTGVETLSYVPHPLPTHWNKTREHTLSTTAREAGKRYVAWGDAPLLRSLSSSHQDKLIARRLESLPKPCGLLCANDQIAQRVIQAAQSLDIHIPDELTIVGIDNDGLICENTTPTITSVLPDFQRGGYLAAELLDHHIRHPDAPPATRSYGPLELIRRQSTQRYTLTDPLVRKSIGIILCHAYEPDFHTEMILNSLNCSRSLLEMRFRQEFGHSIREEVQRLRLERALALLRNPNQTIGSVPSLCGYASEPFFKRMFKKKTGLTMRAWRKANLPPDA